jgi:hypothetical protein
VYVEIKARDAQPPMVVGVRNFTQTRRLARILYGTSYSPYAMTTSQFRHRCQAFARDGVRNTFWFIGRPVHGICTELLEKYQLAQRIVHGRKFSVLVPR